jgi:hypothetical protein
MVKEVRLLFEPRDLLGVRIECWTCHGVSIYPAGDNDVVPDRCPMCQASWGENRQEQEQLTYLLRAVRYFRRTVVGPMPTFRVRFEIEDGE